MFLNKIDIFRKIDFLNIDDIDVDAEDGTHSQEEHDDTHQDEATLFTAIFINDRIEDAIDDDAC